MSVKKKKRKERPMDMLMGVLHQIESENPEAIKRIEKSSDASGNNYRQQMAKELYSRTKCKFDLDFIQRLIEVQYPHDW